MLSVASTGPAAAHQPGRMGVYRKQPDGDNYNNRPTYEQVGGGNNFIFYGDLGHWAIGPRPNGSAAGIATSITRHVDIPKNGWTYINSDDGEWHEDPHLTVSGIYAHN